MWEYNDKVMQHFLDPKNSGSIEKPDAVGEVGSISCGDALKLELKIEDNIITDAKFQTFGCASAIASSSVLTEIIIGKTIEEAEKITNQDIVDSLGDLPKEKIHCSVMGMEALQAAIANYRGVETAFDDEDEGEIICHCFGVSDAKIKKVAKSNNIHDADEIKNYIKAGGGCGCCLDEIQRVIDDAWADDNTKGSQESELTTVQKVMKTQEVIEKEIKPLLEKDGGSIELLDIVGNVVKVRLKGVCASCRHSQVTLKELVEAKIKEFVSQELIVEEVK